MNPCPCGYANHPRKSCRCTPEQVARYRGRLSGPLLDRIDLVVEVPVLAHEELLTAAPAPSSAEVRVRVEHARAAQLERQGVVNARLDSSAVERYCVPDKAGASLLQQAMTRLDLSARAYHRILRVGRTLADMAGAAQPGAAHVAEAIQYRRSLEGR